MEGRLHPHEYGTLKAADGPPHVEPVLATIKDTRVMMGGLANSTVWGLIGGGELRTVRFGRRVMVEVASIHETIARRRSTPKAA